MPPTISDVLAACEANRDSFNNWLRRGLLKESIPATTPGVARPMTRAAALEVAFIAALTDVRVDLTAAAILARRCVKADRAGTLHPWFLYDPVSKQPHFVGDHTADKSTLRQLLSLFAHGTGELVTDDDAPPAMTEPEQGTRFAVVHLAGLVRRIDMLFTEGK